jgi:hypothetical protein
MATKYEPTYTITWESTQVVLSQLAAAALLEFACKDADRPHLGIGIRDGMLCATDCKTGLRYDAPQCEPVRARDLDGKVWTREYVATRLAVAKAEKADVKLEMSFFHDSTFPPFSQVVPEPGLTYGKNKKGVERSRATAIGINPTYLARLCKVTKACGTNGVALSSAAGELDPIAFTCEGHTLKATVVVMPMHI